MNSLPRGTKKTVKVTPCREQFRNRRMHYYYYYVENEQKKVRRRLIEYLLPWIVSNEKNIVLVVDINKLPI
jgi:hypothetical protein